jgi:hypothetical protein
MNSKEIYVAGGFESSNVHNISKVSSEHFTCEMKPEQPSVFKYPDHQCYWFYLKVGNAKGKSVTIDITNCDWMPSHWKHYKPVVSYSDPNELDNNNWEKISVTFSMDKTFRFTHTYTGDTAWVALRYPYTYSYHQKYLASIEDSPFIKRDTIFVTDEGRNLDTLTITNSDIPSSGKKKVVVYAREHGTEQEGSWVCQGIIDYLVSDEPEAQLLRDRTEFLLIPISVPDSVYYGRCSDPKTGGLIACDFSENYNGTRTKESGAIWEKISDMADGAPIDICVSLHSPHGWEENIWSHVHDTIKTKEGKKLSRAIFSRSNGFTKRGPEYKWGKFSLPGKCAREFGSIALLLEINQHAKKRFLTIGDMHKIGKAVCEGINDLYNTKGDKKWTLKKFFS